MCMHMFAHQQLCVVELTRVYKEHACFVTVRHLLRLLSCMPTEYLSTAVLAVLHHFHAHMTVFVCFCSNGHVHAWTVDMLLD